MKRLTKAVELVRDKKVELLHQDEQVTQFIVYSTSNRSYMVNYNGRTFWCNCPDSEFNHCDCKHKLAVIGYLFQLRDEGQTSLKVNSG